MKWWLSMKSQTDQCLWWHPAPSSCTSSQRNLTLKHKYYNVHVHCQHVCVYVCLWVCVFVSPVCSLCFSLSSSGDNRHGSKWIFWTWHSLASISCRSSYITDTESQNEVNSEREPLTNKQNKKMETIFSYFGCVVAQRNMWSSSGLHGKPHNLSFDKNEQ